MATSPGRERFAARRTVLAWRREHRDFGAVTRRLDWRPPLGISTPNVSDALLATDSAVVWRRIDAAVQLLLRTLAWRVGVVCATRPST